MTRSHLKTRDPCKCALLISPVLILITAYCTRHNLHNGWLFSCCLSKHRLCLFQLGFRGTGLLACRDLLFQPSDSVGDSLLEGLEDAFGLL